MWDPDANYPIVCRPALPRDTPEVIALTKTIWEGHDYVPKIWAEWLADPEGLLAVAEYASRVVGLVKLTHLSPGEWWLEGLRVDPEYQGQHVASHLHDYIVDYWARSGDGTLRLTTYRPQVKRLCERTGFTVRCEFTQYMAPVLEGLTGDLAQVEPGEASQARDYALASPAFSYSACLVETGWRWVNPVQPLLEAAALQGRAWWWGGRRGLIIVRQEEEIGDEASEKTLALELLACDSSLTAGCLKAFRRLGAAHGCSHVAFAGALADELVAVLVEAGFERVWDEALSLFERAK